MTGAIASPSVTTLPTSRFGGRIDLYQVHQVPPDTELEDYWRVMQELLAQGKVRDIGLSNHDIPRLEEAARCH